MVADPAAEAVLVAAVAAALDTLVLGAVVLAPAMADALLVTLDIGAQD